MENAGENLQGKSVSLIIEIVGSAILLVCLFLPWITLQIGGRGASGMSLGASYSAFDGINLIVGANQSSPFTGSPLMPVSQFIAFLYFILLLYIINPIVQCCKRLPWLSFYTAWVPVTAGILLLFKTVDGGSDGFDGFGIGAGAVLSLLAGLCMQFSAWTTIGIHHKRHRKYFRTALIWCIVGWICVIAGIVIVSSGNSFLLNSLFDNIVMIYLFLLIRILAVLGIGHTLWLIYGGIVMLFSSMSSSSVSGPVKRPVQEKAEEFLHQVRTRTDEELRNILQHKEDYDERLVKAAKIIMLERFSAPNSSVSPVSLASSEAPVATTASPAETEDEKYKAYWPSASYSASEKEEQKTVEE